MQVRLVNRVDDRFVPLIAERRDWTGEDQTIKLWDLGSSKLIKTMRGHRASIYSLAFSAESTVLVSGGADETVRIWDVSSTSLSLPAAAAAVAKVGGTAAGKGGGVDNSNVLKKLTEGALLDGKASSTVSLLPQSTFSQDGFKDTCVPVSSFEAALLMSASIGATYWPRYRRSAPRSLTSNSHLATSASPPDP